MSLPLVRYCVLDAHPGYVFVPGSGEAATLAELGVVAVDDPRAADVHVIRDWPPRLRRLLQWRRRARGRLKPLLLWTHEPRGAVVFARQLPAGWLHPQVELVHVYSGDIYVGNHHYTALINRRIPLAETTQPLPARRSALLCTWARSARHARIDYHGDNIDLLIRRQQIGLAGHRRGTVDVYGRGWPRGIVKEDSRTGGDWHERKMALLREYQFNIALENTAWPGYISEKMWDAISAGCLPVWWSRNTRVYDDFERESFIDYADFDDPDRLLDFIAAMPAEEYWTRLNRCYTTWNRIFDSNDWHAQHREMLERLARRMRIAAGKA